jgi:hypothetical protein
MTVLEQIIEEYPDCEFIKADGFDDAIVGVDTDSLRLIYDSTKAVEITMENLRENVEGEDEGELYLKAQEYFDFNVAGAKGEGFPIWADVFPRKE